MLLTGSSFELCDLDQHDLPYPDDYFDVIHARVSSQLISLPALQLTIFQSIHHGVSIINRGVDRH